MAAFNKQFSINLIQNLWDKTTNSLPTSDQTYRRLTKNSPCTTESSLWSTTSRNIPSQTPRPIPKWSCRTHWLSWNLSRPRAWCQQIWSWQRSTLRSRLALFPTSSACIFPRPIARWVTTAELLKTKSNKTKKTKKTTSHRRPPNSSVCVRAQAVCSLTTQLRVSLTTIWWHLRQRTGTIETIESNVFMRILLEKFLSGLLYGWHFIIYIAWWDYYIFWLVIYHIYHSKPHVWLNIEKFWPLPLPLTVESKLMQESIRCNIYRLNYQNLYWTWISY